MKKHGKTVCASVLSVLIALSALTCLIAHAGSVTNDDLKTVILQAVEWKKKRENAGGEKLFATDFALQAGNSAVDWYALALGRTGCDEDNDSYLSALKNNVQKRYLLSEKLDSKKATEWHRIALAALSVGGDATEMGLDSQGNTVDLIKDGVYDRGKTLSLGEQGINGYAWGLIALDSMRYEVPDGAFDNRETIITALLSSACESGGFTLDGENPDVDITAMVLQALAPYYNGEEVFEYVNAQKIQKKESVRAAVDRAVLWLSENQNSDGGFSSWGKENCESTAQVVIALCSLGIDPANDSRFIKNSADAVDGLLKYRNKDGGFVHVLASNGESSAVLEEESDSMATEQALCALCALYRYRLSFRSFYDFREEQSDRLKNQIKKLNEKLKTIPENKNSTEKLLNEYLEIPTGERCYVYNYFNLSKALNEYGITYKESNISALTGENAHGCGAVTDIFALQSTLSGVMFNENDLNEYLSLPKNITSEHYSTIVELCEKLNIADNAEDFSFVSAELKKKKERAESIRAEIESINAAVAEKLYPFENIDISDKEIVCELVERAQSLDEYDHLQILGYEELLSAKRKLDGSAKNTVIAFAVSFSAAAGLLFSVAVIRKSRINKKKKNVQNEEW